MIPKDVFAKDNGKLDLLIFKFHAQVEALVCKIWRYLVAGTQNALKNELNGCQLIYMFFQSFVADLCYYSSTQRLLLRKI